MTETLEQSSSATEYYRREMEAKLLVVGWKGIHG